MKIRRTMAHLALASALLTVGALPALAQDAKDDDKSAELQLEKQIEELEALAQESLERLLAALGSMLRAVPQYELPEITDDGDIIIRRVRPRDERGDGNDEPADADADMDET